MVSKTTIDSRLILRSYLHWITDNLLPMLQWYRKDKDPDNIPTIRISAVECSLCEQYLKFDPAKVTHLCVGCPISEKAGARHCKRTPYQTVLDIKDAMRMEAKYGLPLLNAIWEECRFLKNLYEETKKKDEEHKCSR